MTEFRCEVVTADGRIEQIKIIAPSAKAASMQLLAEAATPISIRSGEPGFLERLKQPVSFGRGFGIGDQALLLSQLAALIRAGLPVDRSLDLLVDQAGRREQRASLRRVVQSVRAGDGLSGALEQQHIFPAWVVGVLRSAEQGGGLGETLGSVASRLGELTRTRRELISALTYPAVVLGATLLALALVLLVIVPQFKPIFAGQDALLPLLTRAVLWLSDHALLFVTTLAVLFLVPLAALMAMHRSARFAEAAAPIFLRMPGARLREHYLAAQFAGLLATLLTNGLTLVRALPLVSAGLSSRRWARHLGRVEMHVREGQSLSKALLRERLVPVTVIRLIEVGEKTGKLAETTEEAGRIIDEATRARVQRILALANPIAIVGLGAMVALLVAGVMLGIFAIGDFAG